MSRTNEELILYWAKNLEHKSLSVASLVEEAEWLIDKIEQNENKNKEAQEKQKPVKIGDKITIELEAVKSIVSGSCIGCFAEDSAYFCKNKMSLCKDEDLIFVVVEKTKEI